jgi:DNA-binding winged helix-turn-helix (wHTH) protein
VSLETLRPFRVGEWNVFPSSQRIERGAESVRLGPTAMDVLVTLADRAGCVVTREELLEAVWSGTFVGDEVVTNAIWELRRALGDDVHSPRYIQTLPKKGYRLVASVSRSSPRGRRSGAWKWLAVGAAVLSLAVVGRLGTRAPRSLAAPVRLTSFDGRERDPALSPDERRIAFGTYSELYVVSAEGGEPLRLSAMDGGFGSAARSPDGEWIAFSRRSSEHSGTSAIRVVRALGGSERHVATTTGYRRDIDWSPDGTWLAASSKESEVDPHSIYLYVVDTGEKRRLTRPPEKTGMSGDGHPRFSPHGRRMGFLRWTEAIQPSSDIYVQPLDGEEARRVTSAEGRVNGFDWLPDGSGFVASMDEKLFYVPLDSGDLVPLPFGESAWDVSAGRNHLAYSSGCTDSDIWRIPGPAAEAEAERTSWITSTARDIWPQYSPGGLRALPRANSEAAMAGRRVHSFEQARPIRVETPFSLGRWRVDPRRNVIEARGHRVHVEPKAMRVLLHLARNAGEDVGREALLDAVWRGTPVSRGVLTNAIWELRKALGDSRSEPEFIQTVPGKGYRLVAPVGPAAAGASLWRNSAVLLYALGLALAFLLGAGVVALFRR